MSPIASKRTSIDLGPIPNVVFAASTTHLLFMWRELRVQAGTTRGEDPVLLHSRVKDGRPRDALAALSAAFRSVVRG